MKTLREYIRKEIKKLSEDLPGASIPGGKPPPEKGIGKVASFKEDLEYKSQETEYRQELDLMFKNYRPFIDLGRYSGGRPDSDPLKGKGFGDLSFNIRDILPEDEWKKALDWVESKGFEIKSQSNDYEMEFDGDRAWYPTIKFHFDADKFNTK